MNKPVFTALAAFACLTPTVGEGQEEGHGAAKAQIFDQHLSDSISRLQSAVKISADAETIEKESFRLFLDANRFKRRYGSTEWNAIKPMVLASLGDAASFLAGKNGAQREQGVLRRYSTELQNLTLQAQGR